MSSHVPVCIIIIDAHDLVCHAHMFVIRRQQVASKDLFLQFVQAGQLALRPAGNAQPSIRALQGVDADAQVLGSIIEWHVENLREE